MCHKGTTQIDEDDYHISTAFTSLLVALQNLVACEGHKTTVPAATSITGVSIHVCVHPAWLILGCGIRACGTLSRLIGCTYIQQQTRLKLYSYMVDVTVPDLFLTARGHHLCFPYGGILAGRDHAVSMQLYLLA